MRKRKQTRFTTEQEILDAIDARKLKVEELMKLSLELEKSGDTYTQDRLVTTNKQRHRIENVQLPKLKNALAAFRTIPMESIVDGPEVVL
jgi:hypothetical protein